MTITAQMVKELREKTGVGMMACKEALQATNGNMEKAIEYLRKKGMAAAEKKAGRGTKEGVIEAYIHSNKKIGVMIEVGCETDFVAKNEDFQKFVRNLAMQIASANPKWIDRESVPQEVIEKEKEIYKDQLKEAKKPENVIDKIIEGKLNKFFQENCLLEQEYIRDDSKKVREYISDMVLKLGENIQVKRFVRFEIGE